MKSNNPLFLLGLAIYTVLPLHGAYFDTEIAEFMTAMEINFVNSDLFYSRDEVCAAVAAVGVTNAPLIFELQANGCFEANSTLAAEEGVSVSINVFFAGSSFLAQRRLVSELLNTSMPIVAVSWSYSKSSKFGDIQLHSVSINKNGKTTGVDGNNVAFSRGNVAFVLQASDSGRSVLDIAQKLDDFLLGLEATSPSRRERYKSREKAIDDLLGLPKYLSCESSSDLSYAVLGAKMGTHTGKGKVTFADTELYGKSVRSIARFSTGGSYSVRLLDHLAWNETLENIRGYALALGYTEGDAKRNIEVRRKQGIYRLIIHGETPTMWSFNSLGNYVVIIKPLPNSSQSGKKIFEEMNAICDEISYVLHP